MLLAIQKSYELLAKYGCFAREICDKCGIVLGAVRFTRHGESEVYYPRECRVMLKGLRPTGGEGKSQRFSVRISSLEGLLVYRGEFTLIISRRPGEAVSTNEDQKRWKPERAPVPVAIYFIHFLFLRPL